MKATRLMLAAALAVATTGTFAATVVHTNQIANVADVQGRSSVANATIEGTVRSTAADVATAGRNIANAAPKATVVTGEFAGLGRS